MRSRLASITTLCALLPAVVPAVACASDHRTIGLYIGVGDYVRDELDVGVATTNLDVLIPLLERQFGVEWLPPVMDEDATREGIRAGMLGLLAEAQRITEEEGESLTVLLFYTGHGSRVVDNDGDERADYQVNPDTMDETWVPSDSALNDGSRHVLDDDVGVFRRAVADLGPQVDFVLIVEACHSQSSHRGPRSLGYNFGRRLRGPDAPLFPELSEKYGKTRESGPSASEFIDGWPEARFVCLAACADELRADVVKDQLDREWGRFSQALTRVLHRARGDETYQEIHSDLMGSMQSDTQFPQLYAELDQRDEPFLGGARVTPHVVVEASDGLATLAAGVEAGYANGARLEVYSSLADLTAAARRDAGACEAIASGIVEDATFGSAQIRLIGNAALPRISYGRIVAPAVPPIPVFVTQALAAELGEETEILLREARQVSFVQRPEAALLIADVSPETAAGYAVYSLDNAVFRPSASGEPGEPITRGEVRARGSAARRIAGDLTRIASHERFWYTTGRHEDIEITLVSGTDESPPLTRSDEGITEIAEGSAVLLSITNRSDHAMYLYLFESLGHDGVYRPFAGHRTGHQLEPGETWTTSDRPRISSSTSPDDSSEARECVRFKALLSTNADLQIPELLADPDVRHRGAMVHSRWACTNARFDIVRVGASSDAD
jgi:hypothetical protein